MAAATASLSSTILSKNEIVRAKVALRGVPVGTLGKVIQVQGLSWTRYWVWFDNGVRLGTIDRAKLMTIPEFDFRQAGGESTPSAGSGAGLATVSDDGGGAGGAVMESVNGIPGHLVERSRVARERWAAKKG
jgi:hypothetical protein